MASEGTRKTSIDRNKHWKALMKWRFSLLFLEVIFLVGCQPDGQLPTADRSKYQSLSVTAATKTSPTGNVLTPDLDFPDIITSRSAYYINGPQQGRPADGTLAEGTRVRVVENSGSYSVVQTPDGIHAYVSTGAITKFREIATPATEAEVKAEPDKDWFLK